MSKFSFFFFSIALACALTLCLYQQRNDFNNESGSYLSTANITKEKKAAVLNIENKTLVAKTENQTTIPTSELDKLTAVLQSLQSAKSEYGIFDETSDYQAYTEEVLASLIKNGDKKAMYVLAERKFGAKDYETARSLCLISAMNGSISGLEMLSRISDIKSSLEENTKTIAQYRLESIAWKKVTLLRGYAPSDAYINFINTIPPDLDSPANKEKIDKLTKDYYQDLENQRTTNGLGSFNNNYMTQISQSLKTLIELDSKYIIPSPYEGTFTIPETTN